jgi:hypothetical protein
LLRLCCFGNFEKRTCLSSEKFTINRSIPELKTFLKFKNVLDSSNPFTGSSDKADILEVEDKEGILPSFVSLGFYPKRIQQLEAKYSPR